jgi:uncharacterized protein (DUF983 family)
MVSFLCNSKLRMAISKFQAIIECKCPRCKKGRIFTDSPFNFKTGRRYFTHCPVCNLKYEREPAFFEGGMYFNYAMNVAILVASGVATYVLLDDPNQWIYFGVSASMVVLMVSFTSRLSKSMMLHFFGGVEYDPKAEERYQNSLKEKA